MEFKLNKVREVGQKNGVQYWQDNNGIIFSDPIDQSNMIGGGHEEGRNTLENPARLERIKALMPEGGMVLDFGCGNGLLVKFLKDNNINVWGYDKFNNNFNLFPPYGTFDLVTLIEVIEHLQEPFSEIDELYKLLAPNGKVMIETSFTDWLDFGADYINPQAGHNTIWSHAGLTEMMLSKGFKEGEHINRNVRIYVK